MTYASASFPTLVALVGGDVVGVLEGTFDATYDERFAASASARPLAWVYFIGVAPAHRRAGVGLALLRSFAGAAAGEGCTFLALLPDEQDDVVGRRAFFARCGLHPLVAGDPGDACGATLPSVLARIGPDAPVP
jgi:GNAT superfamily N-acetyltransferase